MTQNTLSLVKPIHPAEELFDTGGRYRTWKKGDVTSPKWLKRETSFDFITLKTERDVLDFEKYLAGADERLSVQFYNTFTTGTDKAGSPMIVLNDMDDQGDTVKRAIVIAPDTELALRVVSLVDHFCAGE